uniref:Small EDRK-rich factor-like N-terminal domain-containing protein n=1 Tax=Parascaris equorum TaxID=6256 RepID=A0A914RTM8_PAREQ
MLERSIIGIEHMDHRDVRRLDVMLGEVLETKPNVAPVDRIADWSSDDVTLFSGNQRELAREKNLKKQAQMKKGQSKDAQVSVH